MGRLLAAEEDGEIVQNRVGHGMSLPDDSGSLGPVRLAHLSDIHVTAPRVGWRLSDWFNKRATGWVHLRWLGRGRGFRFADQVAEALMEDLKRRRPDHVVFSGDASTLGFEEEIARAADLLELSRADGFPGLAVPGNHDYYTHGAASSGAFERHFARWQLGERVESAIYPFAQRVGHLWLIGVNSCTGNFWPWDAAGCVDRAQLEHLEILLGRLEPGPRILVTHYPVCLANGRPEHGYHGLRNLAELLAVAGRGKIGLWLHGHRHKAYHLVGSPAASFPILCAGSATQEGCWSYGEYTVEDRQVRAIRRTYSASTRSFNDTETFDFELTQ
jgi:3',5'-cyclic AMP phosphodiesterase CpdA